MKKTTFSLVLSLGAVAVANAQTYEAVTGFTTALTTGTSSSSEGFNFDNSILSVTNLSTTTGSYVVSSLADNSVVRRNGVNLNQSSVWYASSGVGTNLNGVHQVSYDQMLISNSLYQGSDNTFSNTANAQGGNIERLDFTWNTARIASGTLRFGVFDRGAIGVHDSFAIAAILSVDAFGNPLTYGTLLKVNAGWGGATNAYTDQSYRLFRYNNGSNITANTASSETGTQGVGGVLISTADLGIANGTSIYGYSLMSNDVTDPANLGAFPTNTDGATGGGGIDLAAINGLEIRAIPEPSTLAAFALGLPLAAYALRRKRS